MNPLIPFLKSVPLLVEICTSVNPLFLAKLSIIVLINYLELPNYFEYGISIVETGIFSNFSLGIMPAKQDFIYCGDLPNFRNPNALKLAIPTHFWG